LFTCISFTCLDIFLSIKTSVNFRLLGLAVPIAYLIIVRFLLVPDSAEGECCPLS
jgi:hypothetical protein